MSLPDLKELNKLVTLCRKLGVTHLKAGDLELTLGDAQPKAKRKSRKAAVEDNSEIESDAPDSDALLFWSAQTAFSPEQQ